VTGLAGAVRVTGSSAGDGGAGIDDEASRSVSSVNGPSGSLPF
jgi:hypothetical protein